MRCSLSRGLYVVGCIYVLLEMLHFLTLHTLERTHSLEHLVPVYLCTIELRSVDADKLGLSANSQSACTAHSSSIDHDSVERHIGGNAIFLGKQAAELHHYRRPDGKSLVDMWLLLNEFLDTDRYDTFLAVRTVISHYYYLVRVFPDLFLKNDQVLVPSCQNREHPVASLL